MVTVLRKEEWGAIQPDGGTQGALNRDLREAEEGTQPRGGEGPGQVGGKPEEEPEGVKGGRWTRGRPSTSRVGGILFTLGFQAPAPVRTLRRPVPFTFGESLTFQQKL